MEEIHPAQKRCMCKKCTSRRKLPDFPGDKIKSCEDILGSIANLEDALAYLLRTEASVLEHSSDEWTANEVLAFTSKIDKTLRKVILKEVVLILLLEEIEECKKEKNHCKEHDKNPSKQNSDT